MRQFTELDREEVRRMFQLHDLRESKVWQEAQQLKRRVHQAIAG
jgi:predicted transposase YdaD